MQERCKFNLGVRKIPWSRKWQPIPVFLPGKPHGQRNLVGYSPWGHKELDMTELLSRTQYTSFIDCNILVFGARST